MFTEALAVFMIFSIPLAAILSTFYLRLQKLKLENRQDSAGIEALQKQIGYLSAEQEELRERLRDLEQRALPPPVYPPKIDLKGPLGHQDDLR